MKTIASQWTMLIIILAIGLAWCMYKKRETFADPDKKMIQLGGFHVRDTDRSRLSVGMLQALDAKAQQLVNRAFELHPSDKRIQLLAKRFRCCGELFQELPWDQEGQVAVSFEKGESIGLCIDTQSDVNTHMYVVIHEMAHLMSDRYEGSDHSDEFWKNMAFLQNIAEMNDIYHRQDFERKPVRHCKRQLNSNNKYTK